MLMGLSACTSTAPAKNPPTELAQLSMPKEAPAGSFIDTLGSYKDKALEAVGLKKPELPEVPDVQLPDRKVLWRLHASDSLNVAPGGAPVALLTRIYKLRSPNAFLQAPYEVFGDPSKEKAQLGDDMVETREVQMIPGQHDEVLDKVAREARYVGIVALFRNPSPQRWRYAFRSESAEKTGLSIGLHACAMSVQVGEPIGQPLSVARSAAVSCP
jgi:type VI secretion system protein VasD